MKIPVFLSTTIVCPECQHMIEKLPPGMEEAISNGDLLRCSNCKSWLIVRIEVAKQSFDWMGEAAEQSVHLTGLNARQKEEVRQMIQSALDTGSA